jgi:type II secretory pathway component pulF
METLMKPFIFIYHVVSSILSFPSKILNGKVEEGIETARMNISKKNDSIKDEKSSGNPESETSNYENLKQKVPKRQTKPLIAYRYTVLDSNKKKITGIFEAESESDIRGFLTSQGYEVLKVEVKKPYDIEIGGNGPIKAGALSFALTQMSTYIKAGIPLVDSVRILAKQSRKPNEKRAYERLVYDLLKGENLSDAMLRQEKTFPKLLINMVKTAEMTGDLPSILDDMADYYTSIDQTRRQMISAMTYPTVVIIMALCVLVFMLIYLVPQFVQLYEDQDATLPAITLFIMGASDFLKSYYLWLILATAVLIILFYYLYNNVKSFRTGVQTVLMKTPIIGNIIIYSEISTFTKTFASLLNHGVFITDSMEVLSKITNNEIYKRIIANTLNNLGKGESISKSFKGEWAFPVVAYEMLVTGENTGQLGLMMEKVADHFQNLHKNLVNQMKSLIEPLMIVVLAAIVGVILLAIVVPMFDIYGKIQ